MGIIKYKGMNFRLVVLLAFLIIQPLIVDAQEIEKSKTIKRIDGKEYYIHGVEQGQTLYSISKTYEVPVDELVYENPDASKGLAIGQQLRIPVTSREKEINEDLRKGEFRYIFHIVKKGQTMYGIARIYEVDVNDLKRANPGWEDGLKEGQYVKIPMKDPVVNQQETASEEGVEYYKPEVEQKPYIEHTVASKETLYGIAKKYRVSVDTLKIINNGLTEDIFPGEVIRIPARVNQDQYITHTVREKTKLKSLASKYSVSVTAMKDANPGIKSRVYPGELLMIPVGPAPDVPPMELTIVKTTPESKPVADVRNDSVRCYRNMYKDHREFRVALMIPLYSEEARNIKLNGEGSSLNPEDYKSFNFIQFYEGFLMALEELESEGLKVKLYVYDVDEKVSKTIQVLQAPELASMDLIIGPFFSRNFKLVSNFAEMFGINIVNPLTRRKEVLSNPYVFKMKPSRDAQHALLAKFVSKYHKRSNIILVKNNKYQHSQDFAELRSSLDKVAPYGVKVANEDILDLIKDYSEADTNLPDGTLYDFLNVESRQMMTQQLKEDITDSTFFTNGIAEVIYASDSVYGIIRNASVVRKNLVVVLSNNEIFTPEILTRLNDLKDTFDITVVGMPEWALLSNLETDYLLDLKVHFFTESYYNPNKPEVQSFVKAFRQRFKTQPGNYAFEGYDLANLFMGAMLRFGKDCKKCIQYYEAELLKTQAHFAPARPTGYENLFWYMCRYRNFKVEKINLN